MKYLALLHHQEEGGNIHERAVVANFELDAKGIEDAIDQIVDQHPEFDGWLRLCSPVMGLGDSMNHVRLIIRGGRLRPPVTRGRPKVVLREAIYVGGHYLGVVSTVSGVPGGTRYEWLVGMGPDAKIDVVENTAGETTTYDAALDELLDATETVWRAP